MKGAARSAAAQVANRHRKPLQTRLPQSLDDAEKLEPAGTDHVLVEFLPPKEERVMEGHLEKKAISTRGIKYQPRLAVLSRECLMLGKARESASHLMAELNIHGITSEVLHAAFDKWDSDHKGGLSLQEATGALLDLKMVSKTYDVEGLFRRFDADESESLQWEEFKQIAQCAADNNSVIDYIPLSQIDSVAFELEARGHSDQPRMNGAGNIPNKSVSSQSADDGEGAGKGKSRQDTKALKKSASFKLVQGLVNAIEKRTGMDIDGDGNRMEVKLPKFNPDLFEVRIHTTVHAFKRVLCVYAHQLTESARTSLNHYVHTWVRRFI